ncbi:SDR family NAD(P)-dependent oxidoreductase [Aerococcus urinaeequi]|uniref:SDR family NAD(P)-dependent oxidoreductase n=1 Tax=Aerococcus urinaeequi TaxID=51665 RepID=UPI003D6A28D9
MLLENKVAIITGAGSGFGRATAELYTKEGAKVVVVDYNEETAQQTVAGIRENGGEAVAVKADVSNESDVKHFIQTAIDTYGQIDILFNNAGIYAPGTVEDTSMDDWNQSLNVNITALFLASKYAIPYLKETKGNIINTASAGGIIGFPDAISYATTKGAVISFTRAMAVDYAEAGVRINAICPGTGVTGMTKDLLEIDEIYQGFVAPIPMKRLGEAKDVANAALFLGSNQASYITGHALPVDGGWTMS